MSEPVYYLTGDDFLVDEALDRIRAETETDPLADVALDGSAPAAELINSLETPSLLGGRRLVVVHDAHELAKDAVAEVERYLESPSPHAVLVLVSPRKTKLADAAARVGTIVALEAPKGRALVRWLRDRARERKLKMDERAAWDLIEAVGAELRDLDAALEQLAVSGGSTTITSQEIARMFARHADERIYAFTDAVGERRLPDAMTLLRRLLDQGDEPLVVFGALVAQVRRMLVARELQGSKAIGEALGMPAWRAEKVGRQARAYRDDELVRAMSLLAEADVDMKAGELARPELALERAVIRIVAGT